MTTARGLSNSFIDKTLKALRLTEFKGVYSVDKIPAFPNDEKWSIIVNTGHSRTRGEHFICIYCTKKSIIYCDSLTLMPDLFPMLQNYLRALKLPIVHALKRPVQNFFQSNFCGFYCLYFAIILDSDMEKTLKNLRLFSFNAHNLLNNDKKCIDNLECIIKARYGE